MYSDEEIEKILADKRFWDSIMKEFDEEICLELEAARKHKIFKNCDFQNFIDYIDKQKQH